MMGDPAEEFHMALDGEGRINLPSPRRHGMGALLASATTISWPESTPTAQATMIIQPRQVTPWSNTDLPLEQRHARQEGK
jgi:hypothetical protein